MSDEQIQKSRAKQVPAIDSRVLYPVPHPPVSHIDGEEVAVPTGNEAWFPGTVTAIDHLPLKDGPDSYAAVISPDDEGQVDQSMSVVFLRPLEVDE